MLQFVFTFYFLFPLLFLLLSGRRSILGLYQIAVVPSIIAKPNAQMQNWFPVVRENTLSRIVLSAGDLLVSSTAIPSSSTTSSSSSSISSSTRQIIIQVTKLPLNGVLYTSNTSSKSLIKVNDIINVMKKNQSTPKFEIFYLGNRNFFTFPNKTYNNSALKSPVPMGDYFQFRAVTGGFYSTIVTQRITVRNVNNPTNIDISQLASNPKVIEALLCYNLT